MNDSNLEIHGDEAPAVRGVWAAVGILVLGLVFTGVLWWYTDMHAGPFRELRDAIHSEFPGSSPQVEGGQRKIHKGSPKILRITLRVEKDPRSNDDLVSRAMKRLVVLAERYHGLRKYEQLDVYFVWFRPERPAISRHEQRDVVDLFEAGPKNKNVD